MRELKKLIPVPLLQIIIICCFYAGSLQMLHGAVFVGLEALLAFVELFAFVYWFKKNEQKVMSALLVGLSFILAFFSFVLLMLYYFLAMVMLFYAYVVLFVLSA